MRALAAGLGSIFTCILQVARESPPFLLCVDPLYVFPAEILFLSATASIFQRLSFFPYRRE